MKYNYTSVHDFLQKDAQDFFFFKIKFTVFTLTICIMFIAVLFAWFWRSICNSFKLQMFKKAVLILPRFPLETQAFPPLNLTKNRGVIEKYQLFIPETNVSTSTVCLINFKILVFLQVLHIFMLSLHV